MKNIYLVRHAKSSWKHANLPDFERPLNDRGERDAPFMGELLNKHNIKPDLVISSNAKRAILTVENICSKIEYPIENIEFRKDIYEAAGSELLEIIKSVSNKHDSLMMVGHNPGMTTLSNYLTGEFIDNIPTCGIVSIEFICDAWNEIGMDAGKLKWFEFPGKYFNK